MRKMHGIGLVVVLFCAVFAVVQGFGAFSGWQYNANDADNRIQDNADDVDNRLDAVGLTDATTLAMQVNSLKDYSVPTAATTVTNGQVVTLAGLINVLHAAGGTNNATATITFANTTKGAIFFVCNTGTSNKVALAQTGNFKSPAINLTFHESAIIWAKDTNALYCVSQ